MGEGGALKASSLAIGEGRSTGADRRPSVAGARFPACSPRSRWLCPLRLLIVAESLATVLTGSRTLLLAAARAITQDVFLFDAYPAPDAALDRLGVLGITRWLSPILVLVKASRMGVDGRERLRVGNATAALALVQRLDALPSVL